MRNNARWLKLNPSVPFLIATCLFVLQTFFSMSLNARAEGAGSNKPEFDCQGYNTILYSNETKLVAICHGSYAKINNFEIEQWQDCYDSTIYVRDKNKNISTVLADCSPIRYTKFRLVSGALAIKYYYDPYSSDEQEPFVLQIYNIPGSSSEYKIIADLKEYTKREIEETVHLMKTELEKSFNGKTYFNVIYGGFDRLRAYAAVDPDFSLNVLNELDERYHFDGEVAETLSIIASDIEFIKLANRKKGRGD